MREVSGVDCNVKCISIDLSFGNAFLQDGLSFYRSVCRIIFVTELNSVKTHVYDTQMGLYSIYLI